MRKFEEKFVQTLNEDISDYENMATPEDVAAMRGLEVDDEVADSFAPPNVLDDKSQTYKQINEWINKVETFKEWIAGGKGETLHVELNKLEERYEGATKECIPLVKNVDKDLGHLASALKWMSDTISKEVKAQFSESSTWGGNTPLRLKKVLGDDAVAVKIYWNPDWEEFVIKPFINGKPLDEDTWDHNDDKEDVMNTATAMLQHYLKNA
jgi:hypothetical protein